jgi:hypothetical protein
MAKASVLFRSGVQIIRTGNDSIAIPHMLSDGTAGAIAENTTLPVSDPTGESLVATPRKFAQATRIGNETLADSTPAILDNLAKSLLRSVGLAFDASALEGNGTAPNVRGLKNVVSIIAGRCARWSSARRFGRSRHRRRPSLDQLLVAIWSGRRRVGRDGPIGQRDPTHWGVCSWFWGLVLCVPVRPEGLHHRRGKLNLPSLLRFGCRLTDDHLPSTGRRRVGRHGAQLLRHDLLPVGPS